MTFYCATKFQQYTIFTEDSSEQPQQLLPQQQTLLQFVNRHYDTLQLYTLDGAIIACYHKIHIRSNCTGE